MAYGIIGFGETGAISQPSATIWGDCSSQELLDEGLGYFTYETFVDAVTLPDLPSSAANSGTFTYDANFDHALLITTGSTSGNGAIVYNKAEAAITPNSGVKLWFEALISKASITNVEGVFVGLVNKVGQTNALVQAASATAASNLLTSVSGTSLVGFWSHGDQLTNFDAVWVNAVSGTGGLQPTTGTGTAAQKVNTVVAQVLTLPTATAYPNSLNPLGFASTPLNLTPPAGVLTANSSGAGVATPSWVKLGLRYDGLQYLYFYVNGSQVAKMIITSSFDIASTYGGAVAVTTGAAAAYTLDVGFFRSASKLF